MRAWMLMMWGLVAVFASGCVSGPPYPARAIGDPEGERRYPVQIMDEDLVDLVEVGSPSLDRIGGTNQLSVQVAVRNVCEEDLELGYDVEFLDGSNQPYGDRTSRQVLRVRSGDTRMVSVMSLKGQATGFIMRMGFWR